MPSSLELTIGKQLALAVLGGDYLAAYALADKLQEERARGEHSEESKIEELMSHPCVGDGYAVYHWPEFQAFCKRAGIMWGLRTKKLTITLAEGEVMAVQQEYLGTDRDTTTTMQNQRYRTSQPRATPPEGEDPRFQS